MIKKIDSDSSKQIELISIHIPKTAGSTFGHIFLKKIYDSSQIFYDYEFVSLEKTTRKLSDEIKVIHGHFPAQKYYDHFLVSDYRYVVWLRHPFSMLISWYFFWLSPPNGQVYDDRHKEFLDRKMSFREFLNMPYTRNGFSDFYLSGVNLKDLYFCGVQEFFLEDLKYFMRIAGCSQIQFSVESNKNQHPEYERLKREILEDKEIVKRLTENNDKDLELYQLALQLRHERVY
jgi:Sulfotransferase family